MAEAVPNVSLFDLPVGALKELHAILAGDTSRTEHRAVARHLAGVLDWFAGQGAELALAGGGPEPGYDDAAGMKTLAMLASDTPNAKSGGVTEATTVDDVRQYALTDVRWRKFLAWLLRHGATALEG